MCTHTHTQKYIYIYYLIKSIQKSFSTQSGGLQVKEHGRLFIIAYHVVTCSKHKNSSNRSAEFPLQHLSDRLSQIWVCVSLYEHVTCGHAEAKQHKQLSDTRELTARDPPEEPREDSRDRPHQTHDPLDQGALGMSCSGSLAIHLSWCCVRSLSFLLRFYSEPARPLKPVTTATKPALLFVSAHSNPYSASDEPSDSVLELKYLQLRD